MNITPYELDELIKLSQFLYSEEARIDINSIADTLLEILYDIKYDTKNKIQVIC